MADVMPVVVNSESTESHENPFLADGELSKKAEYIISHSKISRSEIKIEDPDLAKKQALKQEQPEVVEDAVQKTDASAVQSERPTEINVKDQNGKLEEPVTPSSVEVVEKANTTQAEPQQAEQVKLKDDKKCKCCTIM
ncbi:hypothetical protein LSH36_116g03002 [Paralvinella palmiformis]|uniref:Uncharacterized protein n=1 Tax=Paralvinella palmiformis TaxID=53620 RepID=A0AAD9JZR9_9ANNE|nr:hypothetical protein LSH36_116g03002 [Paralvinella palmiformis]